MANKQECRIDCNKGVEIVEKECRRDEVRGQTDGRREMPGNASGS
jgi:hypothetical protein